MDYSELIFQISPILPGREVLLAELSELDFESFVEEPDGLKAYIQGDPPSKETIESLAAFQMPETTISWEVKKHEKQNWNAVWEASFEPIFVEDQITVRAPFHDPSTAQFDLIIQPKMSFGTGHHDTTWLMLRQLLALGAENKAVLDMGAGTGVLAILAEKLDANYIEAIDIDDWAQENCEENAALNGCSKVMAKTGDSELLGEKQFDLVLANINRNVLTADMATYRSVMKPGADLLLSGFFPSDFDVLKACCAENNLQFVESWERNGWGAMHFKC